MEQYELEEPDIKFKAGFDLFFENFKQSGEKLVPFVLKFYQGSLAGC
jgi:hypothetical protein